MELEQSTTSAKASSSGKVTSGNGKAPASTRSSMRSYRDMSYREKPATPNSPSGTTVTTMYDHLLSPPSPVVPPEREEKSDRLPNDLLDEICNDMGIDDSMDLDFDDFCYTNGQQKPGASRFINTPNKAGVAAAATANIDAARRNSGPTAAPTASGYATSDSLCAIAKLTQSINTEGRPQPAEGVDTASDSGGSHENMKIEPLSENRDEPVERVNESDQMKQLKNAVADKRKRDEEASSAEIQHASCAMDSGIQSATTTMSSWQSGNYTSSQSSTTSSRQAQPASLDYYHQDDFTMEDMTAPDTMINFSEMPQQPNYYQLPQSARDRMTIGFNMSLTHGGTTPNFTSTASHSSLPHQTNPFQRPVPHAAGYNAQIDAQQSFRSPVAAHSQYPFAPGRQFNQCQAESGSNSAPASMQPIFGRSDSAPTGSATAPSIGSAPSNTASQTSTKPSTPPQSQVSTTNTQTTSTATASSSTGQASSSSTASTPTFNSSQQGFMQRLVTDKSSAFRSHPLFPLLRDLIIADMNFHEPTFPHQLIRDLPSDFNKLLKNYLSRNPPRGNYQSNHSVESVVLDALKYAHHTLIEKIQKKKSVEQGQPQAPPSMPAGPLPVETHTPTTSSAQATSSDYSVKFENSMRENMSQAESDYGRPNMAFRQPARVRDQPASMYTGLHSPYSHSPLSVETASHLSPTTERPSNMYPNVHQPPQYNQSPLQNTFGRSLSVPNARNPYMSPHGTCPPPNYTVSPNFHYFMKNPPLPRHQQLYEMGPPGMYHDGMSPYSSPHDPYSRCMPPPPSSHLMYVNNINNEHLVKTMMEGGKDPYGDETMSVHSMQGSTKVPQQGKQTEGRKHASLPKEAVNIMLNWLREHQDKPYPNDDEKGMLIKQTGLSITQINYWFTNARRRLLPKWRGEDM